MSPAAMRMLHQPGQSSKLKFMNLKKAGKETMEAKLGWKAPTSSHLQVFFTNLWKTTARSIHYKRWFVYRLRWLRMSGAIIKY